MHLVVCIIQAIQALVVALLLAFLPSGCDWPVNLYNYGTDYVIFDTSYDMCWILPCFPAISAVAEFVQALWSKKYGGFSRVDGLNSGIQGVRWIESMFSSGLMLWMIATLSGMSDVINLIQMQMFNVVIQLCGWHIESEFTISDVNSSDVRRLTWLTWCLHVVIWIPIFVHFGFAVHEVNIPTVVNAIAPVMFVMFSLFGILQLIWVNKHIDKEMCEMGYVILSFVAKTTLLWMIFGGARRDL